MMLGALLTIFLSASHGYVLVSDLDDTIKITHSASAAGAVWNGIFTKRVFAGMPEYLRSTVSSRTAFYVVTGSTSLVRGRITELLRDNQIIHNGLMTRNNQAEAIASFKLRMIRPLMAKHPGEDFIFLGDDVDQDPEIYARLAQENPGRVRAIYIRPVRHRAVPREISRYLSATDIAISEYHEGRFPQAGLDRVNAAILASPAKWLLPAFAWCPVKVPPDYACYAEVAVTQKIEKICEVRQSVK